MSDKDGSGDYEQADLEEFCLWLYEIYEESELD